MKKDGKKKRKKEIKKVRINYDFWILLHNNVSCNIYFKIIRISF